MPPRRKSNGQKSEPKLFRCSGYGDCDMTFTRSEHLARHARKHTGEKPFKCVVPDCDRMFSRFDNMMQHTQTHNRLGKRKSLTKSAPSVKKRRNSASVVSDRRAAFENNNDMPPSMISTRTLPLPRRMSYSQSYPPPPLSKSPSLPDSPEEPLPRPMDSFSSAARRRLSAVDLKAPIHSLSEQTPPQVLHPHAAIVDITSDEYEALQGFGKFASKSQTRNRDDLVLPAIQPNQKNTSHLASHVAAFRQKIMPAQESFQRPTISR